MAKGTKQYLGDGVYVDQDGSIDHLILTTEDGIQTTNTIYLGPIELKMLDAYRERIKEGG
jgi:hypothetical protein